MPKRINVGQLKFIFQTYPYMTVPEINKVTGISKSSIARYKKEYEESGLPGVEIDTSIESKASFMFPVASFMFPEEEKSESSQTESDTERKQPEEEPEYFMEEDIPSYIEEEPDENQDHILAFPNNVESVTEEAHTGRVSIMLNHASVRGNREEVLEVLNSIAGMVNSLPDDYELRLESEIEVYTRIKKEREM
jgi:transcriptional regulator with XRE-family HTH domain